MPSVATGAGSADGRNGTAGGGPAAVYQVRMKLSSVTVTSSRSCTDSADEAAAGAWRSSGATVARPAPGGGQAQQLTAAQSTAIWHTVHPGRPG